MTFSGPSLFKFALIKSYEQNFLAFSKVLNVQVTYFIEIAQLMQVNKLFRYLNNGGQPYS